MVCLAMVEPSKDLTEDCRAAAALRRLTISLEEFISWIIEECEFAQLGLFAKIQAIIAKPRAELAVGDLLSLGTRARLWALAGAVAAREGAEVRGRARLMMVWALGRARLRKGSRRRQGRVRRRRRSRG